MYQALLPYFGGKRKLANKILNYAEGETFIDGFMGGGSVSLLAKAKGFRVIANDIAERSVILGRALIENDNVFIEDADIVRLFVLNPNNKHFIRDNYPKQYKAELIKFLDNARANIEQINDPIKKSIMMLLWMKVLCYYRPMAAFGHVGAVDQLNQESEHSTDTIQKLKEHYSRPIYDVLKDLADEINGGVFTNGLNNEVHQKDIFEFLKQVKGDTIYLDPPYYGSESYEYHYRVFDSMITGKKIKPKHSIFNTKQVFTTTAKLFEACRHISTWLLSVGQRVIDKQKYINLMSDFRKVEDVPVVHIHAYAIGNGVESGKAEILLVGRS